MNTDRYTLTIWNGAPGGPAYLVTERKAGDGSYVIGTAHSREIGHQMVTALNRQASPATRIDTPGAA
jgi:hypothetical protein